MNIISQTQINAYERCKRYYFLKVIRKLVWPVEAGVPRGIRQGEDFHLLVRQLILGFPPEKLIIPENDADVERWVRIYLSEQPLGKPDLVFAEKEVSVTFADILWLGKFDALTLKDDRLTIFDWKTGSLKPDAERFRNAPQTRLYRFLARTCSARLLGASQHSIPAENIEMVYWFPEFPQKTVRLPYSEEAYQQDISWLKTKAAGMSLLREEDYPKTEKTRRCEYCEYRTCCFPETYSDPLFSGEAGPEEELFQYELFPADFPPDDEREEAGW